MQFSDTGFFIDDGALGNYARNTAASVEVSGSVSMKKYAALVMRAMRSLKGSAARLDPESGAARWLLDNRYVAESPRGRSPGRAGFPPSWERSAPRRRSAPELS